TTYASQDYMDAYFSIDADNAARSGLDTFDADAGFKDVGVEVALSYSPWERWNFTTTAGYTRLLGDAADSPIVDDEGNANQYSSGIVVTYNF
ncbi:MAG: MipA/OmpV family protein, partial [bacterium]|nr:MipA/OmpV family protein [bacterium]